MGKTVAQLLVESLSNLGVKRVYGVVGDSLNGITDCLRSNKNIEWIHTRHEEVAAFAAGAEAFITDQITVCAGSCGPGNLHLINGLFDCQRNDVPVLALAAHIPSTEIGSNYFQATHPEHLFKECSVFCEHLSHPDQMPRMLSIAIQTAIAKKGVAVIVISGDIALQHTNRNDAISYAAQPKPQIIPNNEELERCAKIINRSKKITILGGYGCRKAHNELIQLAKKLNSPIVHALRGKEFIEYDNPFDVGMTGFIGIPSGYHAMESSDTLIILGSSFPYCQFYPTNSRIIQIDIDGSQLGKRTRLDFGAIGDIGPTIQALLPLLKPNAHDQHLTQALKHYASSRKHLNKLAINNLSDHLIHPNALFKQIDQLADEQAIFSCDVGTPTVWAARYLTMNGQRRLLGSFNHGSMANALAQAIGAQCAAPKKQVIALCGDGGFSMMMGDIISLNQLKLPIKVIIVNNGSLGFVELEMKANGLIPEGTSLDNPSFADMANAIGIHGVRVEKPQDLINGINEVLNHPGPALLDAVSTPLELIMPPFIKTEHIKRFGLYTIKAILSGHGNELLEMGKANWRPFHNHDNDDQDIKD